MQTPRGATRAFLGPRTLAALASVLAFARPAQALYGGSDAPREAGASAVYFDVTGPHLRGSCSGTLIAPRVVLTAAHCVRSARHGALRASAVRVGNPLGRTTRAPVARVEVDPEFDAQHPERGHDVALLVLARPIEQTPLLRLAAAADDPTEQGTRVTIDGFGLTRRGRATVRARGLRSASLEYLSPFHCFSGDVERMATTRMCAASPQAGVCPGDSGSGATIERNGERVLVGVVSLAIDATTCANTAAVLTRVSAMRAFIDRVVASAP